MGNVVLFLNKVVTEKCTLTTLILMHFPMMLIKLHDDLITPAVPMKNEPVALAVDPIRNVTYAPMFRTAPSKGER